MSWGTMGRRHAGRTGGHGPRPRSGCTPRRCCGRCPRNRCSRFRWATSFSPMMPTWRVRSAWMAICARERNTGDPDRRVPCRRHGRADLRRRGFPARAGSRAPDRHRSVGSRDQDERGGMAARIDLRAFSGGQGIGRGRLLQREGAGPLLSRSAGDGADRRRPRAVREARRAAAAIPNVSTTSRRTPPNGYTLNTLRIARGAGAQRRAAGVGAARSHGIRRRLADARTMSMPKPTR